MSKRRAFEQRINALNNHDMKTIINIISNSLYVYNQILWQCPNFDLITIGDCFNLGSVDLVRHMCKECTLANSYTSYHPLFKYSRGKGSILASESLLSSVTMFYKIKKPSVSTRFLPLETIVVMSLTYSIKNPSSKWRFFS